LIFLLGLLHHESIERNLQAQRISPFDQLAPQQLIFSTPVNFLELLLYFFKTSLIQLLSPHGTPLAPSRWEIKQEGSK
jgi:hypothetical protein